METSNKPGLVRLASGESFKILEVTGQAGMQMPLHYSTKEAVLIVQEGIAILKMDEKEHVLKAGDAFIIPALQNHGLLLKTDFKSLVLMSLDSNIEFVK
jgi:quercetin dioxygenase-like cupin family protein